MQSKVTAFRAFHFFANLKPKNNKEKKSKTKKKKKQSKTEQQIEFGEH